MHLIQRGNNRQACFVTESDFRLYLEWLRGSAGDTGCRVHAYVLMTNHVHLLLTAERTSAASAMMKALGERYVRHFNRKYRRTGTLWEGRFRSCPTETESYFLSCQRYIELNPVRAGMVAHPAQYRWSSYRANAQGEADPLVHPHEVYLALGVDSASRQAAWQEMFQEEMGSELVDMIRRATNGNFALGSSQFTDQVASVLGLRATPGKPGRPRNARRNIEQADLRKPVLQNRNVDRADSNGS
ncbi:MAG: transposase [Burkholderiaceae bacterium]|nr:transposase [Burkholderiaceae bacterium]